MVVPKQRHALGQRAGSFQHFTHPPGFELHPFAQLLLAGGLLLVFGFEQAERRGRRLADKIWRGVLGFAGLGTGDHIGNDALGVFTRDGINFSLCGRKTCANQQVAGLLGGHLSGCQHHRLTCKGRKLPTELTPISTLTM